MSPPTERLNILSVPDGITHLANGLEIGRQDENRLWIAESVCAKFGSAGLDKLRTLCRAVTAAEESRSATGWLTLAGVLLFESGVPAMKASSDQLNLVITTDLLTVMFITFVGGLIAIAAINDLYWRPQLERALDEFVEVFSAPEMRDVARMFVDGDDTLSHHLVVIAKLVLRPQSWGPPHGGRSRRHSCRRSYFLNSS
ncbi:MAG TPA: hypothetical protein VG102_00625 [Candidatus Paceibacterota bacterium]|jgi:hypothetical protein|nr:hypothetical protein [Candidatus Paceibacterota bacterium]